jgi:hypothetical protein
LTEHLKALTDATAGEGFFMKAPICKWFFLPLNNSSAAMSGK